MKSIFTVHFNDYTSNPTVPKQQNPSKFPNRSFQNPPLFLHRSHLFSLTTPPPPPLVTLDDNIAISLRFSIFYVIP
ncbi:hypothetical protein L6452_38076 [Arctium lappa]|uniref:Uncharacterized protein n=1 Tax=Arctium lappa TaxID=4217 RepID=A0ACB8Y577_ARCLA|nr:hypothetical protein L6452_38076 [Arctium lappa]